jgi:hypothetical protein
MKKLLYITALLVFFFVQENAAQNRRVENKAAEVSFQKYDSYFEKNNSGLKGGVAYLVLRNQTEFDKVFGTAATMDNNSFLPDGAFDSMLVLAAIKRNSSLRKYEVTQTAQENGKLYVRYKTVDEQPSTATFSSPLILAVPKGKYKKVVFVENGKEVKSVNIKK